MRAGWLRHRVTIQSKTKTQNAYSEEVITWSDVATIWGSVEPLKGREFLEARAQVNQVDTRIRLRHRPGIIPEMRVLWTDDNSTLHTYNVESAIRPFERKRELHLMCTEVI